MSYLDGVSEEIAVQSAIEHRRIVIGADKVFTDKGTVKSAQIALKVLAQKTGNSAFDPIEIDGKIGPHTRAAVSAFNAAYGWYTDGDKITEGTFVALQRPDVMDPPAHADAPTAPPPLPPTPKQVDKMVEPVVSAPIPESAYYGPQNAPPSSPGSGVMAALSSAFSQAMPEPTRSPSVFQRAKPRNIVDADGKPLQYPEGKAPESPVTKWIFIGVTGVAGLGVLWLVVDALRGKRGRSGYTPRRSGGGTLVGYRRT